MMFNFDYLLKFLTSKTMIDLAFLFSIIVITAVSSQMLYRKISERLEDLFRITNIFRNDEEVGSINKSVLYVLFLIIVLVWILGCTLYLVFRLIKELIVLTL